MIATDVNDDATYSVNDVVNLDTTVTAKMISVCEEFRKIGVTVGSASHGRGSRYLGSTGVAGSVRQR